MCMSWNEEKITLGNWDNLETRSWLNEEKNEIAYLIHLSDGSIGIGKCDSSNFVDEGVLNNIRETLNISKKGSIGELTDLEFDEIFQYEEIESNRRKHQTHEEYVVTKMKDRLL